MILKYRRRSASAAGWTPESLAMSTVQWWHYDDLAKDGSFISAWPARTGGNILRINSENPLMQTTASAVVTQGPGVEHAYIFIPPGMGSYTIPTAGGFLFGAIIRQDSFVPGDYHKIMGGNPDASVFIGASEDDFMVTFGATDGATWNDLDPSTESGGAVAGLSSYAIVVVSATLSGCVTTLNGTERNYRNGTGVQKATYSDPFAVGGFQPVFFATAVTDGQWWDGAVQQIILAEGAATTDDRQRLEGYLAHASGLQSSLPASHPYKLVPP